MPTALTTSKRKFHTLLDNLTRPSPRSNPSTPNQPCKRPRLSPRHSLASAHPLSPPPHSLRTLDRAPTPQDSTVELDLAAPSPQLSNRNSADSPGGIRLTTRTARILSQRAHEQHEKNKETAQYNPWSRPGFLARLKTFADLSLWTPGKPDGLNEVVWASRGWSLDSATNTVACKGGCEARVVVALRPPRKDAEGKVIEGSEDWSCDIVEGVTERFAELVVEGHGEGCMWRLGRGCRDDIMRVSVLREVEWQEELRQRYTSLAVRDLPPAERIASPVDVEQTIRYLGNHFFTPASTQTPTNHSALHLALTGWTTAAPDTLNCQTCFRRIGLWLYTRSAPSPDSVPTPLDPLEAHRHYCPWANASTQAMPSGPFEGLPAYDVLLRIIASWSGARARARKSLLRSSAVVDEEGSGGGVDATDGEGGGGGVNERGGEDGGEEVARPSSAKSREEIREEDRKRFARLREVTRAMGLGRKRRAVV